MGFDGKKILIIGGAQQHCKLVEAAHRLGVSTVVVDYLGDSPAKRISDKAYCADIFDYPQLLKICSDEQIDGVVSGWLDPCQIPYAELCSMLGLPYYGSIEAFRVMTNKQRFKDLCLKCGVGTIPYVSGSADEVIEEIRSGAISYPLFVKPSESRGSRGQSVCRNLSELKRSVIAAVRESNDGKVIVEQYMEGADDVSVTLFYQDGVPIIERISDRLLGEASDGLSNVCIGTISPSKHKEVFKSEVLPRIDEMCRSLGVENGPVFLQGFVESSRFYFYDPGLRFPGGDYERALYAALGIDVCEMMIDFAINGRFSNEIGVLPPGSYLLGGRCEVIHDVCLSSGTIRCIEGLSELTSEKAHIVSVATRYEVGAEVPEDRNVVRRFAEINFLADTHVQAASVSKWIDASLNVWGDDGRMELSPFSEAFDAYLLSLKGEG